MQKHNLVKISITTILLLSFVGCANKVYSFTDGDDTLHISDNNVTMSKALYLKITDSLSECMEKKR